MSLSTRCLILATILFSAINDSFAQDTPPESKPVVITNADLEQLSLSTRKELQELIDRKKENPQPPDLNIKVGPQGGIFEGDLAPGRTEIKILGRTIRLGDKRNRRRAQVIAVYDENAPLQAPQPAGFNIPDDMTITITKSGRQPMSINIVKGGIDVTISGEQLDQLVEQYKPYVIQMLKNGLSGISPSSGTEGTEPGVDLGAPATDLGAPASDLGEPAPDLGEPVPELGKPKESLDKVIPPPPPTPNP